jgi:hypothetical protein
MRFERGDGVKDARRAETRVVRRAAPYEQDLPEVFRLQPGRQLRAAALHPGQDFTPGGGLLHDLVERAGAGLGKHCGLPLI